MTTQQELEALTAALEILKTVQLATIADDVLAAEQALRRAKAKLRD